MVDTLTKIAQTGLSRRGFLAGAGVASAATLIGCGNSAPPAPAPVAPPVTTPLTDVDILNFALNLEYLEAEFYLQAATGSGIPSADRNGGPAATVPAATKVNFANPFYQQIANELAQTELQHVRAIQATITALKGTPIPMPQIDYVAGFAAVGTASAAAAKAAVPPVTSAIDATFNPFADALSYFVGALTFEDVGVTAYTGAAGLITDPNVLSAAAGIQAAESYHAGSLRTILVGNALATGSTKYVDYYNSIIAVRTALGGAAETTLMTGSINTPSSIVAADSKNSLAFPRTTDQVLHIVYGQGAGVFSKGAFFPNGLNGTIKNTAA